MLKLGGSIVSVLDRSGREKSLTTSTASLDASPFGLRGYVDTLSPLVAMHHHDLACA